MRWGVVADPGNQPAGTVDQIDEKFVGLSFSNDAVNRNLDHKFFLYLSRSKSVAGAWAYGSTRLPGPTKYLRRLRLLPFASAQPRSPLQHCVPTPLN